MEEIDFKQLYELQDQVLEAVFLVDTTFYLTGGTCLHRFYFSERYSVDLDFFTNDTALFREDVRDLLNRLDQKSIQYEPVTDFRDFVRIMVEKKLRVDLICDRVYRSGKNVRTKKGLVLDNLLNLCANKVCAILGRDEPKDVFDLYTVYRHDPQDWAVVMEEAGKKCVLDRETLAFRLDSFPVELVESLHVLDKNIINVFKQDYPVMLREMSGV
ncbi:protein of unknown function DUF1814 [Desulfonatronospira thiodismutans ASO3-1]|uniref:Nucleotidyl transferase AbiEii/AbiGii toxin family protein n=1 Tax=Desulfonatronospira thiodismutans ASO3-1 TaxID=555779 RepID=D6SK24_9BACT|nr:nucleotidyl transferase AbiEii/AbiGii toxin family protein [Desulfonatronospira thiodismutans]EFI36227.1 protein of unknown function DUF1814 [Desulfonatronospira thiodismutans ASO3-1]